MRLPTVMNMWEIHHLSLGFRLLLILDEEPEA